MKIITVYSLKGGCGKTTLSILMAQYLVSKGFSVSLLDSDISQKSSYEWAKTQNDVNGYLIENNLTKSDLQSLKTDFVIVDGAPRTNDYIKNILQLSDIVVIPIQPTQLGVSSLLQDNHLTMLSGIEKAKPDLKIKVVINGTTAHNQKDVKDVKNILAEYGFSYHSNLGLRKAFTIDYDKPFMQCKNSKALNELGYLVDTLIG